VAGLALVSISGPGYPSLPLGDFFSLEEGDALLSLGYPLIAGVTESESELSEDAILVFTSGTREGIGYMDTDSFISPGTFGGPVVDEEGRLMGINTFPGLIIMVERLKDVLPFLREGSTSP
jgi:S1-C subfamily serine protease